MKQVTAIATALVLTMALTTTPAFADGTEATQETSSKSKVECTTGSYGQNVNCVAESEAKAKQQVIVRKDGTVITPHKPEATSLDTRGLAIAAVTLLTGVAGVGVRVLTRA